MDKKVNKKIKFKPAPVAATAAVLAVLVGILAYAAVSNGDGEAETEVNVQLSQTDLKQKETADEAEGQRIAATVEIQAENAAVPVGTRFKVTAIVTPDDTEQALVWTSSDTGIFEVDADGIVTVKGIGTSVLTATVGTVTDAIVIEGIETVSSGSQNAFPVYTVGSTVNMDSGASGADGSVTGSAGQTGNGNGGGNATGSAGQTGNGNGGGNATGSAGQTGNGNGGGSSAGSTGQSGNGNGGGSVTGNAGQTGSGNGGGSGAGNAGQSGNQEPAGAGAGSADIGSGLPDMGFSQLLSNVYVCQEGDTYYGEIITQPNVTIIYIKRRNDAFDSKIQSVLETMVPNEYRQVWNNYLTADTDRTFTADNRKIRIVVAANGGHSQIVIYN